MLDDGGERAVDEGMGGWIPLIARVRVTKDAMVECLERFGEVDVDYCVNAESTWMSHGAVGTGTLV